MSRASASCEVWIDGTPVACRRDQLAAGEPTILDPLDITWGRQSVWEQPDPGSIAFRLQDQRINPSPIFDTIHVGSKIDVFAEAPNPNPQPEVVMDQDFEGAPTTGGELSDTRWALEQIPASLKRTNLMTDPSMTTTAGKNAGGSATIAVSNAWAQFGTTSISVTPNGSNNGSTLFPVGLSGMTAFAAGQTYTVSAYVRITAVQTGTLNANARRIVFYQEIAGGGLTIAAVSDPAPNTIGVHRLSLTHTVPAGATQALFSVFNGSSVAAQVMWVDGVLIQAGSALDVYFDGTTTRQGYTYEWTGTANASTSTERYAETAAASTVIIYDADDGWPPGQGSQSALLYSFFTRARYLFPPEAWDRPWFRDLRPMLQTETWTYSFMCRLPVGTTATFTTRGFSSSRRDGQSIQLTVDGGLSRTIVGTGNWETYTGTVRNATLPATPRWPVFALQVVPENQDLADGAGTAAVDAITYTAPPLDTFRVQVWAGRVTNVDAVKGAGPTMIEIDVTGAGEIVEVENVAVGDEPWPSEWAMDRLNRIIELIPLPVTDFSVSEDDFLLDGGFVIPRDVDSQPALDLIRDLAGSMLGVVWPISVPGSRNHAWIENTRFRYGIWSGPSGSLSACNMPRDSARISQSPEQTITVAAIGWQQIDPDGNFIEQTHYTVDTTAAEIYGARRLAMSTQFSSELDAESIGGRVIDRASASRWALSGVQFDTRDVDNIDGKAQELLLLLLNSGTRPGSELTITDLPEYMPVDLASGCVEGGTITYSDGRWVFGLTLSARGEIPA